MQITTQTMIPQSTSGKINVSTKGKSKSAERLSSGYRINRSQDDAAGLKISETMRWQVRGINKAAANCEEGTSYCQVADGAMEEIQSILQRMRELSIQAANDTNTIQERSSIQSELNALTSEIGRITTDTTFNEMGVFDWERRSTDYTTDTSGAVTSNGYSDTLAIGNQYGITEVLGAGNVYSGTALDESVTFAGSGWTTTGQQKYNGVSTEEVKRLVEELTNNTLELTDRDFLNGAAGNRYLRVNDYVVEIKYGPERDLNSWRYTAKTITLKQDGVGELKKWNLTPEQIGSAPLDNGAEHGCAWMDFSGLGTDFSVEDLYGQGFNTTCATSSKHYSIMFTGDTLDTTNADGTNYTYVDSAVWPRLEINISDCVTGEDVVSKVLSAVNSCDEMNEHYVQYVTHRNEPGKLYVVENRSQYRDGGISTFEPAIRDEHGEIRIQDATVTQPSGQTQYTNRQIWIQSGSVSGSGLFLDTAKVSVSLLGIRNINVVDHESAETAMAIYDSAMTYLSKERTRMGVQNNRLQSAMGVDAYSYENTQAAESKLRDTDMGDEIINHSIHSIIEQAGTAVLSHNVKDVQGALQFLES